MCSTGFDLLVEHSGHCIVANEVLVHIIVAVVEMHSAKLNQLINYFKGWIDLQN